MPCVFARRLDSALYSVSRRCSATPQIRRRETFLGASLDSPALIATCSYAKVFLIFQYMLTRIALFLLVALGGAGLTTQMAWNARLRMATGSPILTTLISIFVSFISLASLWLSGIGNRGSIPAFSSVPKWAWFGGVFAVYYLVASLIAIPKLGAAAVFSFGDCRQ